MSIQNRLPQQAPLTALLAAAFASAACQSSGAVFAAESTDGSAPRDAGEGPRVDAGTDLGPDAALDWVEIPGGSFVMGCAVGNWCGLAEFNPHDVTVEPFQILATEITQAQYLAVMGENPAHFAEAGGGASCGLDCPVETIDWLQTSEFCARVGGRLPTEAEFEYAAGAGATTRFVCGEDEACLDGVAWYEANAGDMTHPVGTKHANAWGLYDMQGNVWEWVEECWHPRYDGAPSTGEVWSGGDCTYRVLRGSSYLMSGILMRLSFRDRSLPTSRTPEVGGRCAR